MLIKRALFVIMLGLCTLCILAGIYWILAVQTDLPGSAFLHGQYESTAKRMGVGVEYKTGPWSIGFLIFVGVTGISQLLRGFRER